MARHIFVYLTYFLFLSTSVLPESTSPPTVTPEARSDDVLSEPSADEPPEGYYAFVESPNATPPRVRPPPYRQVSTECAEARAVRAHVSANNLCGDLNRGVIPRNPMGQNPYGEPYPFDLIRNHTLRFLSRTLPVLRADDTLPRVTHLAHLAQPQHAELQNNRVEERSGRSLLEADSTEQETDDLPSESLGVQHRSNDAQRDGRKFCDGGGVFCMLYRAINGESESSSGVERREDPGPGAPHAPHTHAQPHHRYEGPPTPCPARVEYATPVFARNYQGVWRYVVQIPYEGYFTQTVEVTRCMQSRCHYLEGGCLSSPRWVSLLVAELHYPSQQQQNLQPDYQQFIQNRAGQPADTEPTTDKPLHCDGHDDMGCYQVRLYYDWFLVPGSCKCWRPDYFARYVRRKNNNEL